MKIYKWEWYVVFSRSERWDVAQRIGGWSQRVHLTYTTDPLYVQGKIIEFGKKKKLFVVQKPTKSNREGF